MWTIPARVRGFTGRAELLAELEAALRSGGPTVVQAVTGMGGIGKTTAAIEYAHRHRDEFDIAWWVPAEDPALIPERLAELALALDLTTATSPVGVGVARLLGELARRDRWLVVFDNAEDPRALSRFLPEGPGQVLITSRNPAWRGIAATVGVREFTRAESIALLRRLAPDLTEAEADRVADAVGDLPLAVEQAGSLLADTGMTVDKYLRLLAERAHDVLDHDPGGAYPQSRGRVVGGGVRPARRRRSDRAGPADVGGVVRPGAGPADACSPTTPTPSPTSCGRSRPTRWCWRAAPRSCTGGAWRRCPRTASSCTGSRQRCCAPAAEDRMPRRRLVGRRRWSGCSTRTAPGNVRIDPGGWPLWRQLLPHVLAAAGRDAALDAVPAEATRLLDRAATYLLTRGELQAALAPYERAYEVRRDEIRCRSPRHPHLGQQPRAEPVVPG